MAASPMTAPTGVVLNAERKSWRQAYGDLPALIDAAEAELDAGQYENAWTAYHLALGHWLRERWVTSCGKANSPIHAIPDLLDKLRSSGSLDSWTVQSVKAIGKRPLPVDRRHIEVYSTMIRTLTLQGVSREEVSCPQG